MVFVDDKCPSHLLTLAPTSPFLWSLILSAGVVFLSVGPLTLGRIKAGYSVENMSAPRALFDQLPPFGKRAAWAHQNCFESFTLHAPACLLALLAVLQGGELTTIASAAAFIHPFLRVAYIGAYVGDVPPVRGLCWASSILCSGILYLDGFKYLVHS